MSSSRGATGAGKPRPQNVNSVYSGRNTAAGKASGPSKHGGLQTLGKAPAVVRRMPPPATLPSLKAEHGQDPNVVLVPQGGTGWSKSADSVAEGKPNQQSGSSGGPDLRPNWAKPALASTASTDQSNAQAVQQPVPAAPSAATVANNREFPTLAASVATTKGTTTGDSKPPNPWGTAPGAAAGNQNPEVVTPVVPVTQAPSSGYIGASGPKNADRKLPERYYGGPDAQPRPAAPKKYDIRQKLAQLSVESKEPPTEPVREPKPAEKSATPEEREERRPAAVHEEKPMPVFHPPDFSQPPPPVPPQNVSHAHGHGQAARPPYNQQRPASQSQDVRQYSQHHPPPSGPPSQATDGWNFDYEERHRGPPSAPPSGHGDTGYPPYGQMPPSSGAYHHQQRSFGAGDADHQRHRGYDSRATEGGYPTARFEDTKPPTYPQQSMGYGDSRYSGSGSFVNPPQETGWGDEPLRRHERSPSTQQAQQQRYRTDSRGTSESEGGWYAPVGGRPPSYASNSVRPAETGWGDPVRPPSYPTSNAPMDSSMDVGSYNSRSRTTSYNNAQADGNFGGTFVSPGRDSAVDKSRQKRRVGNESSNASEGEFGTVAQSSGFDTLDQSASDFDHSGAFNGQKDFPRRGNDRNFGHQRSRGGSQRSAQQSQEQPAYRMLKRNDEKSAQYLAHHGGSFLPSSELVDSATREGDDEHAMQPLQSLKGPHKRHAADLTEAREQESGPHRSGKHAGGGERNAHRYDQQGHGTKNQTKKHQHQTKDSVKEIPKTSYAVAPEAQKPTAPSTTPAVKTAVPPPPPENVWEKRMEERQKSAERDNGIQKPLKHLESHFPPISEADKAAERLKAAEQDDIFASSQRQKYEHQDARYGQSGQQNRRQHEGKTQRLNQWKPPVENGNRWDELTGAEDQSRPANDGDDEGHFEDNTYEGTRREFYNSRNRGVGRRAPAAGVGLAGRVKRHGLGRDAHRTHPVPRRAPDPEESDYKAEAKPNRNRNEPEDSFANMGEFHAEDYAIPEGTANRGKGKKGGQHRGSEHDGSVSAEGVQDIEPSQGSHRPEKRPHNGDLREKGSFGHRYSGAYQSGRNWQRGGIRTQQDRHVVPTGMEIADDEDAERSNGICNAAEKTESEKPTSQHRSGPRRGGRGGYSDRPRGAVRKTAQFGNKFGQAKAHRPSDRRSFHTGEGTGSLKSPITSDGAGEEWETASESSDFAERSGRPTHTKEQSPHDNEHQKKRPPNRDRPTRARPSHNRNGHNGDASEQLSRDADARSFELTSERQSQNSRRPTGQKNAKPASHTYQDRNAFGKNNSESAKAPTNSRPKQPQGAVHAGNSRAESVSNDSKNARDSRNGAGSSTASGPSVKDGLAGVDINDASVIVIDDHPDIPQSESHSEAGEFEEVLSKKSKKIRQLELEEERKREQRERERQEKALARKNKAQQLRAEKAAARKAERKSASEPPKEASEASVKSFASSEIVLGNNATGARELMSLTKEQQSSVLSTLNGTAMDEFVATVWNSSHVTAKVTNAMESAPKVIPSPIARPTPKTSNASMNPTNNEKSTVEFATSSSFGTTTMSALSKSGSTTNQYDFTLEPALTTDNESTELPSLTDSSESGLLALRPTAGITLPSTTATTTSSEHIQLQEKLDKVKDVWSGEQTQADFRTSTGLIGATESATTTSPEKAPGNPSLSQAHGPNVAKVKPQPQIPSLEQAPHGRSAHAGDQSNFASSSSRDMKGNDQVRLSGANDTQPSCYLSTSTHVPLAPQSPLTSSLMPQGASLMFGMGPFTPTAASHNSFPPFPMMPNSGDFMPQSFAPQLPANSPPSQFFGQNVFAQRSRPNSFIESHPMLMATHPPHNSGNAPATPWSAGPSGSLEMLGNGCLTPSQPQMTIGPTSVFAAGNVYGNASGNTRFAGQQHAFVTGNAHHGHDFSSQPPSRPPTAVSAGTGNHAGAMSACIPGPNLSVPPPPIMPPTHIPPPTHMPPPNIRPPQFLAGPFAVAPSNLGPMNVQRSVPSHPGGNNVGVEARIFSNVPGNFARGFPAFPPQGVIIRQAPPPPPTHHFLPNGGHHNRPPPQHMPPRRPESQQNARPRDSPSTNTESLRSSHVSAQTPPATWGAQKTDQTSTNSARNPSNGFDLFKMNFSTSSAS